MAPPVRRVAVVGGGVIGLTSAVAAIENEWTDVEVTVVSEKFSPCTTADGSAGILLPYIIGDTHVDTVSEWLGRSVKFFAEIYKSPDASDWGVGLLAVYYLYEEPTEIKSYLADALVDSREMTQRELALFPAKYKFGIRVTTYIVECQKFLPMLLKRFKNKGGKVIEKKVGNIAELAGEYDVVINCPGVEAAHLVPDPCVQPVRGQVTYVKAPWINHGVIANPYYILPHSGRVVLGGTSQVGDWNTQVDPADTKAIWRGCTELMPSLEKAEVLSEWVGLRPGRPRVRLERETLRTHEGDVEMIHNYGHGGSGVTLCWGCAQSALQLLKQCPTMNRPLPSSA